MLGHFPLAFEILFKSGLELFVRLADSRVRGHVLFFINSLTLTYGGIPCDIRTGETPADFFIGSRSAHAHVFSLGMNVQELLAQVAVIVGFGTKVFEFVLGRPPMITFISVSLALAAS